MKVALINDNHCGVRNDHPALLENFKKSCKWVFDILEQQKVKRCLHLGDLYDRRKYINFATAKTAREHFLEPLERHHIKTDILAGNHDEMYKNTDDISSLQEMIGTRYKNITIHTRPRLINIDGLDIQLIPWINEENKLESFNAIKTTKAQVIMGHFEINGFEQYRGHLASDGINSNIFSRFDLVFSGHYHHQSASGPIYYLGALGEYIWSDCNDPRGFHIFDTDTREAVFYQNELTMFRMIEYDDVKHPDMQDRINKMDFSVFTNNFVKVVCVNRTNGYAFDMLLDNIYKANPVDISVVESLTTVVEKDFNDDVDQTEDTPTILNKYIDGLQLPVDNTKMKTFMRNVYDEALSIEHTDS
jgi:DNA repair exonuclease SbcCD nuclease subunit